jgi:pSer/pThr/pTyr-binding forkhead associated (FHA) protein
MAGVSAIEAERGGRPFLVYRDGEDREQVFAFEPGSAEASVGRQQSSDLVLDWDGQVSRLHARFERVDDHWAVVDDGLSRNGTFVNGERLNGRHRLSDGDSLRFGSTTMTFRSPPVEQQAPAAMAAEPTAEVELSSSQRRVLEALCAPYKGGGIATPPTDEQIAEELFLSPHVVKTHLKVLFAKLDVDEPTDDQRRVRLVERAFQAGVVS